MNWAFAAVWCFVGVVVFRFAFGRLIRETTGVWVATIAVVLAFVVGYSWPYSAGHDRSDSASVDSAAPTVQTVVAPAPARSGFRDTSRVCSDVQHAPSVDGVGFLDTARSQSQSVSSGASVVRSAAVIAAGWAVEMDKNHLVDVVCLTVDGRAPQSQLARMDTARPDVAANLGSAQVTNAGFMVELPANTLAPGSHVVRAFSISSTDGPRNLSGSLVLNVH